MAMAFNGFIGLGKETDWGTEVARTSFLRFLSFDFQHNPNLTPLRHSQSRYQHGAMFANYDYKFSGKFEARPDALGEYFRSIFSVEPVTTNPGTLAYEHHYIPSPEGSTPILAPYTQEARFGTAGVSEVGTGGLPTELAVTWDNNLVTVDVAGISKEPIALDTPTASPSYAGSNPLMFHQLSLTPDTFFGDGTDPHCVRGGSIQIQDTTTEDWCNQERFLEPPERGALNVQVQLQMTFKDMRDCRRYWSENGTDDSPTASRAPERALSLQWSGDEIEPGHNFEMGFDFTKLVMQPPQKPMQSGNQILQTVVLNASYDEGASKLMDAHLKNTVASY